MRRSSDLTTTTVSNWIPQLFHWRPATHRGTSARQRGTTQAPAWKPASHFPNQESHSAFSAHGSWASNPIGVVLLQVRWTMPGHSRAEDCPPDCRGQRRRKGRPGRADSFALMFHGDYIRIPGRPTAGGGTPCSGCSLGMSQREGSALAVPPIYWEAKGGKWGEKLETTMP